MNRKGIILAGGSGTRLRWTAAELGITLRFEGQGVGKKAFVAAISGDKAPALKVGDCVVAVDPRYFRPTDVETLLGDPTKAKTELGWVPEITAQQTALLRQQGFHTSVSRE